MNGLTLVATNPRPNIRDRCQHAIPHCPSSKKYRRCSHPAREIWGDRGPIDLELAKLRRKYPPTQTLDAVDSELLAEQFAAARVCYWHGVNNNPKFQRLWIKLIPYWYLVQMYGETANNNLGV